jgi:hypothetical protein
MMPTILETERAHVERLAASYRAEGYDVQVQPAPHERPDFLPFQPDLIVTRGDDRRVVEVKLRHTPAAESQARRLAALIEAQPGWAFELVVVGDRVGARTAPVFDAPDVLPPDALRARLASARRLLDDGDAGAALLVAWSSLEGALRLLARAEGVALDGPSAQRLLKRSTEEGLIDRSRYRALARLQAKRHPHAYGLAGSVAPDDVHALTDYVAEVLDEAVGATSEPPVTATE